MNILVVDDEKEIADIVELYLKSDQYSVYKFYTGKDALAGIDSMQIDLALLDVMLSDIDGFEILKKIREKYTFPVIMLTAKTEYMDKITGLTLGADDYIPKPFNPLELVARVKSHIRRYTKLGTMAMENSETIHKTGGLCINDDTKEVTLDGEPVKLTPMEYNILRFLVMNAGKVFSIEQIYENIWNEEAIGVDNTVAVHIRHIREKIEINPKNPTYLKVVWGVGYKVEKL